ncbi:MAG TPA: hypothetical protein VHN80_30525, partial [Kineosporiaceae bacterium]|nr:hypothetical protein [Kineosporiaceae bacterium]
MHDRRRSHHRRSPRPLERPQDPRHGHETTGDTVCGLRTVEVDAPDKAMTVRTNPVTGSTDYLGVVGRDYTPVQNEA